MALDLLALATLVVKTFLVPLAKLGSEKYVEAYAKQTGETAAKKAEQTTKRIWNKVRAEFQDNEEEQTFNAFEQRPELSEQLLITVLEERLKSNPNFAEELNQLANPPEDEELGGARIVKAHLAVVESDFRNAKNFNIIGSVHDGSDVPKFDDDSAD
jgi:hypothetical protein